MIGKSLLFALAAMAGTVAAGTAAAQNSKFEGVYLGAYLSYSSINAEFSTSAASADATLDGFGGGGLIGYGGTNGWLYGGIEVEGGYDGAEYGESASVAGLGSYTLDFRTKAALGVSGRIGAVVADNFLVYGKIGYVRTNAEVELQANLTGIGSFVASASDWYDGFRFGGGLEGFVADNIGVRAEYTYTIYSGPDVYPGVATDADQHLIRLGASYYF